MTTTVEVIEQPELLAPLKAGWDALADKQRNPLVRFDWFYCCAQTINRDDPLRVVVVRNGEDIIAIAPLCLRQNRGITGLELLGSTTLYEPSDFLYTDADALAILLRSVARLGRPVVLLRIPDEAQWRGVIRRLRWRTGAILTIQTVASTFLRFASDWHDFFSHLSSRRKNDIRRKRRRLEALGTITTEFVCPDESRFSKIFDAAMAVEDRSWKGRQGSSLLKNTRLREFFEAYAQKARERGALRFCLLYLEERPIAMQIAVLEYETLWILKLGYDDVFARSSPGFDLTVETFHYCADHGVHRYEFLGSEELWQDEWPIERRRYMTVLLFPYGWRGLVGLGRVGGQFLMKSLGAFKAKISDTEQHK